MPTGGEKTYFQPLATDVIIAWLLEEDNPSVRYFTLKNILDLPETAPEVKRAHQKIMGSVPVVKILAKQKPEGYWGIPEDFYVRAKYKGTVWNIILLAELGADGNDARIRNAAEFILTYSQDRTSGGFAYLGGEGGGRHAAISPCLSGNMVYSLIRFGYLEDPRLQRAIEFLVRYQRLDDGESSPPKTWPFDKKEQCYGKHTCMMGAVKIVKALAEIPPGKRSQGVKNALAQGAGYLLKHHVFKKSHNPAEIAKEPWTRFGFPRMWETDALEMLFILTKLGYNDPRMQEAIDLVLSKRDEQGRWLMENSLNHRFLVAIEKDGKPGKWVTLKALTALKFLPGANDGNRS